MNFSSPEKFNLMISDGKPGVPVKGTVRQLKFLTGTFTRLTNRLTELLRPSDEDIALAADIAYNAFSVVKKRHPEL